MELVALADRWNARRPDDPASAFACRFPGRFKQAAGAVRLIRRVHEEEHNDMALSDAERAKLYLAEKNAMKRDMVKMTELVAYYRELVPDITRVKPPPHYFIIPAKDWSYGRINDGFLKMLGKECGSEEAAIDACWEHYDSHVSDKVKKFMDAPRTEKKEAVDLSLDDEDEPEDPPVRTRRRRIAND